MDKPKLFSVYIKDCRVDTFTVGGHGGSGKDTSNTGVRITHPPSKAIGRSVDTRSQWKNKQIAWRRMAETKEFRLWVTMEAARLNGSLSIETQVEEAMDPKNLLVEVKGPDGKWLDVNIDSEYTKI